MKVLVSDSGKTVVIDLQVHEAIWLSERLRFVTMQRPSPDGRRPSTLMEPGRSPALVFHVVRDGEAEDDGR